MAERDFNLQMTGEQVKDALQQLEDRVAEGWAVGEHDGVPVTSGSPYFENNAKYYAEQAGLSATAAASSAATAEQEVEEGIRQGIVGAYVQESATPGAIVTIDDGAYNIPLKDLKVNLAINQPGTGDPSPTNVRPIYPVTEAEVYRNGKNLIPSDFKKGYYNTSTWVSSDQTVSTDAKWFKAGQYTLSCSVASGKVLYLGHMTAPTGVIIGTKVNIGTSRTFSIPEDGYWNIQFNFLEDISNATVATMNSTCQVEVGDTATAYEAPVVGTQHLVNIGINQWDEEWEVGTINNDTGLPETDANNIRSANFCACLPNTDYYLKGSVAMRIYWYASDQSFISGSSVNVSGGAVTSPATAAYFKVRTTTSYGSTYLSDISINYPSRFTSYYPYTGNVVYGGELDVTTGVLTARYASVDLGTLTWTYNAYGGAGGGYTSTISNLIKKPTSPSVLVNAYADRLKQVFDTEIRDNIAVNGTFSININGRIKVSLHDATDATTLTNLLSGVQLVYELATPISIQLTPTEVDTLRGDNVIWAYCGDITNCEYRADLKMYIDKVVGA